MKLGDGRKVTMQVTPDCDERERLATEASLLLAEWLRSKDDVRVVSKRDLSYEKRREECKTAKRKLDAANSKYSEHVRAHGCG
jgi:hypothetical protein